MQYTDFLHRVHDLVTDLRASLPEATDVQPEAPQQVHVARLQITYPHQEDLRRDLLSRHLSSDCQQDLLQLYHERLGELDTKYQQVYYNAVIKLPHRGQENQNFHLSFRSALSERFTVQALKTWQAVLQEVDHKIVPNQGYNELQNRDTRDNDSERDAGERLNVKSSRGHDTDAVRILEQAFQYTPNITQAEKYRLAEVTGLKPKQVTIWVSTTSSFNVIRALTSCRRVCANNGDDVHNSEMETRANDEGLIALIWSSWYMNSTIDVKELSQIVRRLQRSP